MKPVSRIKSGGGFWRPTRKPVGPVEIDWTHPLADGLQLCVVPGNTGNLVDGARPTYISDAAGSVLSEVIDGEAVISTADVNPFTAERKWALAYPGYGTPLSAITIAVISRPVEAGDYYNGYKGAFFSNRNSSNNGLTYRSGSAVDGSPNPSSQTFTIQGIAAYSSTGYNLSGSHMQLHGVSATSGIDVVFYADGGRKESKAIGAFTSSSDGWLVGKQGPASFDNYWLYSHVGALYIWSDRVLTDEEWSQLYQSPYQFLRPANERIWSIPSVVTPLQVTRLGITGIPVRKYEYPTSTSNITALTGSGQASTTATGSVTSDTALTGSGQASTTATGSVTSEISINSAAVAVTNATAQLVSNVALAGSAQAVSSGQAKLAGSANLAGSAQATASANGQLSVKIQLDGAAVANAIANAALNTGIDLAGLATSQASGSGTLVADTSISGFAQAVSTGIANIKMQISLNGSAIAETLANAQISGTGELSGTAQASSTGSGVLITDIPISGAAAAMSSADGSLNTILPISGTGVSISGATGGITVEVDLSGDAIAQAISNGTISIASFTGSAQASAEGSGTLMLNMQLDGNAIAQAIASGALFLELPPAFVNNWTVKMSNRNFEICSKNREYTVLMTLQQYNTRA